MHNTRKGGHSSYGNSMENNFRKNVFCTSVGIERCSLLESAQPCFQFCVPFLSPTNYTVLESEKPV